MDYTSYPTFLSTPSARRATQDRYNPHGYPLPISIHALREEGDDCITDNIPVVLDISIHALREEGDKSGRILVLPKKISIHALREEGDATTAIPTIRRKNFYPRPPRGGRR